MPGRRKIDIVLREVREAIGRLLSNAKVVNCPLDIPFESRQYEYPVNPVLIKSDYEIQPVSGEIIPGVGVVLLVTDTLIDANMTELEIDLSSGTVIEYPILEESPGSVSVQTKFDDIPIRVNDDLKPYVQFRKYPLEKIEKPKLSEQIIPQIDKPELRKTSPGIKAVKLNGIVTMRELPIEIQPAQWSVLNKKIIVEAWNHLKDRACMKFGRDPGKDLEMTAIFMNVDFSVIKSTTYNKVERTLSLFVREPEINRRLKSGSYAIIIGLIRGTGEVLQVAMKLAGS